MEFFITIVVRTSYPNSDQPVRYMGYSRALVTVRQGNHCPATIPAEYRRQVYGEGPAEIGKGLEEEGES
jgi:hypothetical protein